MYIFDFDGVLCRSGVPYEPITTLYTVLIVAGHSTEIWTTSPRFLHEITDWLDKHELPPPDEIRVPLKDRRTSPEIKLSWAQEPGQPEITLVFDDLLAVCSTLKSHGIPVCHVR